MNYSLYGFVNGNMVTFSDPKYNIHGWYDDKEAAMRDFIRAVSLYDQQIILVEHDKEKRIIQVSGL